MSVRGPRLEFAVGAFLLLALASLLVLALASSNGKFGFGADSYPLKARFSNLGQLRPNAPVKIGGVTIGSVADIQLSFPLEAFAARGGLDRAHPRLSGFLQRIHARAAYQRALQRGGEYRLG